MPFCLPDPRYCPIERLGKPFSSSSIRIGSNASWRVNASIFFIGSSGAALPPRRSRESAKPPSALAFLGLVVGRCRGPHRGGSGGDPGADRGPGLLGHGDELLRVPVHAVLDDVEAGLLLLGRHP